MRTRFKAVATIEDCSGHADLGVKWSKEAVTAFPGVILAKLSIVPE